MRIRDRIKDLRRVKAGELRPHPKNWRTHPPAQRDALRGMLAEIGYADALLARELPDGTLELIDGHLRAELTPDAEVPVLVVDLDDGEAAKLLALLDPLAGLAETDQEVLADLLADVDTESDALRSVLDRMLAAGEEDLPDESGDSIPEEVAVPEAFQIVVECRDEVEQKTLFERLTREGWKCRVMNL